MPTVGEALGGLLGNDTINQIFLYNLMGTGLSVLMEAFVRELEFDLNSRTPNIPLSPAELASAVVRGFQSASDAANEALKSGIDPQRFQTMIDLAGQAPGPGDLAEALRRGIIPEDAGSGEGVGFRQGIAQGNLADKWADMIKQLAVQWPTPTDALQAVLEGQIDDATGRELYQKFGGDPDYYQLLFDTRGNAPTPLEAATMARRGVIPKDGTGPDVVSFEQAFLEGPWRNKWLDPYWAITEYHPPPRTITAMVREGSVTPQRGAELLRQAGVPDDLVQSYIESATSQNLQGTKDLAQSTVTALYEDQLIDQAQAVSLLQALKYSEADANFILSVSDMRVNHSLLSAVITKIRSLYIGHKINDQTALNALNSLSIPPKQVQLMMTAWQLARDANVTNLTAATIADAVKYGIIDPGEALDALQRIGYLPHDAWIYLSVHLHGAIPGEPPAGPINPLAG